MSDGMTDKRGQYTDEEWEAKIDRAQRLLDLASQAYADGEADMRERAAKEVLNFRATITHWGRKEDVIGKVRGQAAAAIRALPIEKAAPAGEG